MWSGDEARLVTRSVWFARGLERLLAGDLTFEALHYFYGPMIHTHPPAELFAVLAGVLIDVSEFCTRLPFAFLGILAVPLVYRVGRRLFGADAGLVSAMLYSLSPYCVGLSREGQYWAALILASCIMIGLLWKLVTSPTARRLQLVLFAWSLTALIHMDAVVVFPLILSLGIPVIKRTPNLRTLLVYVLCIAPTSVFYLLWAIVSFTIVPVGTGFGYVFTTRSRHIVPLWENIRFYLQYYFPNPSVAPLFMLAALGPCIHRRCNTGSRSAIAICWVWIALFLVFFLFVNRVPGGAYLLEIVVPLTLLAGFTLARSLKGYKCTQAVSAMLGLLFSGMSVCYLANPDWVNSPVLWGFRSSDESAMQAAAFAVRKCVTQSESVLSNINGYAVALYTDRAPVTCAPSLSAPVLECQDTARGQETVGAVLWDLENQGQLAALRLLEMGEISKSAVLLNNAFYVAFRQPCEIIKQPVSSLARAFRDEFGTLHSIREVEPWLK